MHCRGAIYERDHQVILITKKDLKTTEEVYFHINCWKDYFNKSVINKAKENVSKIQKQVGGILNSPMIRNVLSQVQGTEQLIQLSENPMTYEDEGERNVIRGVHVKPKKKNGTKTNRAKKK
jgi:hypothetical protein